MDHRFTAKVRAVRLKRKRRSDAPEGEEDQQGGADDEDEDLWTRSVFRSGIANSFKGMRLVLRQRPFGTLANIVAWVAFVGGIFNVLEVFFVSAYLGYPAPFLGLLISANAAGVLLGSAWFRQLDAHIMPITTFTFAVLGMGLATAGFVSSRDLGIAILWAAAMGVANGMVLFAAQTALVETGDRAYISRLFVGYETLTALWGTIGIIVGSVAATFLSIGIVLGLDSALLILGALGAWLVLSGSAAKMRYRLEATRVEMRVKNTSKNRPMKSARTTSHWQKSRLKRSQSITTRATINRNAEPEYRPPSRQVNRAWAEEEEAQDGAEYADYAEDAEPEYAEEDESQWEPAAPVEEPPAPRRSLRLRPSPWEQSGGPGRKR